MMLSVRVQTLNLIICLSFKAISWLRSFCFEACAVLGISCKQGSEAAAGLVLT